MERKRLIGLIIAAVLVVVVIKAVTSTPQAQSAPSPVPSQTTSRAAQDGWQISTGHDPMNDAQTVEASIAADDQVQGWLSASRPALHVGCYGGKTRVYVWTGAAASVEEDYDGGPSDSHTVTLRFDDEPASTEQWFESNDNQALFEATDSLDGTNPVQGVIVHMVQAKSLLFKFTPFNANPVIARFNLQALGKHVDQITKACGWTVE